MTSAFVAIVGVAVCGTAGPLGYFAHRFVCLLQTEVECMETATARQEEKAERINRAIRTVESVGESRGDEDDAGATPMENTVSEYDGRDGFCRVSRGGQS